MIKNHTVLVHTWRLGNKPMQSYEVHEQSWGRNDTIMEVEIEGDTTSRGSKERAQRLWWLKILRWTSLISLVLGLPAQDSEQNKYIVPPRANFPYNHDNKSKYCPLWFDTQPMIRSIKCYRESPQSKAISTYCMDPHNMNSLETWYHAWASACTPAMIAP